MTNSLKFRFLAAIFAIVIMSFNCSGQSGKPQTKEKIEAALTNFSISLVVETQKQAPLYHQQTANGKGSFFEMKCERMQSFDRDFNETFIKYHKIDFVDFTANKVYKLDVTTKTGKVMELDAAKVSRYKGFDMTIANYLLMHENYKDKMKKTGKEKILGRDATVYTDATALEYDTDRKFWIDDQYGFTLKYVEIHGDNKLTASVTEFIVGSATVEGLVNLNEYKIEN